MATTCMFKLFNGFFSAQLQRVFMWHVFLFLRFISKEIKCFRLSTRVASFVIAVQCSSSLKNKNFVTFLIFSPWFFFIFFHFPSHETKIKISFLTNVIFITYLRILWSEELQSKSNWTIDKITSTFPIKSTSNSVTQSNFLLVFRPKRLPNAKFIYLCIFTRTLSIVSLPFQSYMKINFNFKSFMCSLKARE